MEMKGVGSVQYMNEVTLKGGCKGDQKSSVGKYQAQMGYQLK